MTCRPSCDAGRGYSERESRDQTGATCCFDGAVGVGLWGRGDRDHRSGKPMKAQAVGGLSFLSFPLFEPWSALVHGAFFRHGGVSSPPYDTLNVSFGVGDDPEKVAANRKLVAEAVGWDAACIVSGRQLHGRNVAAASKEMAGAPDGPEADILVTDEPGVLLLMKFADCVPIVLWDPKRRVVALVHAGWRGTVLMAPAAALQFMAERYRSRPSDVLAGIGPSIGPCCYEVGTEVAVAAARVFGGTDVLRREAGGKTHFDLWAANAETLMRCGVAEENIELSAVCTRCRSDLFFSHRAAGGLTGRFAVVAGIRDV